MTEDGRSYIQVIIWENLLIKKLRVFVASKFVAPGLPESSHVSVALRLYVFCPFSSTSIQS